MTGTDQPVVRAAPQSEISDDPAPYITKGLIGIGLFVLVFLVGGAAVPLDAAVVGQGRVVVAGNRHAIQHRDGGIVASIAIRDGQVVEAGDPLLSIDVTELSANENVLFRQTLAARMLEARLQSTLVGAEQFDKPAWIAELPADRRQIADDVYLVHRTEFESNNGAISTQIKLLDNQIDQIEASLAGVEAEITSAQRQHQLTSEQLASLSALLDKGFASQNRVRDLGIESARLEGVVKSLEQTHIANRSSIAELREQRRLVVAERTDRVSRELREVRSELLGLEPQLQEVQAQITRADVRAPVSGQILGLSVFTSNAVVAPGQLLMEIVPEKSTLQVEAMIRPQDGRDVQIGQDAKVQLTISSARAAPRIDGIVSSVSADQMVDDATGAPFFKVLVDVATEEMNAAFQARNADMVVGPGVPASVVIPVRGRTALGYLWDPISDALWSNLRE